MDPQTVAHGSQSLVEPMYNSSMSRARTGSVYQRSDGLWVVQVLVGDQRRRFYAQTREAAVARAAEANADTSRLDEGRRRLAAQREAQRRIVREVLAAATADDWSAQKLEDVLVAQMTTPRIRHGVSGPCVYCGTWLADIAEHAIPPTRGGAIRGPNVVSACSPCNLEKGNKTPAEFKA